MDFELFGTENIFGDFDEAMTALRAEEEEQRDPAAVEEAVTEPEATENGPGR